MCHLQFCHLHGHTKFSIGDSTTDPYQIAKKALENGMKAFAITDHGIASSWVQAAKAAKQVTEEARAKEIKRREELGLPIDEEEINQIGVKFIPGCCLPDQIIYTSEGPKEIKDIKVGDMVLTHKGRYRRVLRHWTRPFKGHLYGIEQWNNNTVWLTEEHPIYVEHYYQGKTRNESYSRKEWVRADSIHLTGKRINIPEKRKGRLGYKRRMHEYYTMLPKHQVHPIKSIRIIDYINSSQYHVENGVIVKSIKKNHLNPVPNEIKITEQFMKLLGYFLAEGSFESNDSGVTSLVFTFNYNETEYHNEVATAMKEIFNLPATFRQRKEKSICEVVFYSTVVASFFEALLGKGAKNKRIPQFVFNLPTNLQEALLIGIEHGDAKITSNRAVIKLANKTLIYQIKLLYANLGFSSKITEVKSQLNGKTHTHWSIQRTLNRNSGVYTYEDHQYVYMPIKNVLRKYYEGLVYNFEVEEDNSYVGECILHNCEIYETEDRLIKSKNEMKEKGYGHYHLLLLPKNNEGLVNLNKIISDASLNGLFDRRNRTDLRVIKENGWGKHIIATSACLASRLSKTILSGDYEKAKQLALEYASVFEEFYLELQDNGIKDQYIVNDALIQISQETGLPLVFTKDYHYLNADEQDAHDTWICIGRKLDKKEKDRLRYEGYPYHFATKEEMYESVKKGIIPQEAYENTVKIAEKCNVDFDFKKNRFPKYKFIPKGHTADTYLRTITFHRLLQYAIEQKELNTPIVLEEYMKRLDYELKVISDKGYSDYFLILHDIFSYCKKSKIPYGPGRGSGAGSLVAFLCDITGVDPIRHGLLFERFLNPERMSSPDEIFVA